METLHSLPGLSITYSAAWNSYEDTGSFIFLTICFSECRKLGWQIPEPVLSAMDRHFRDFQGSETNEDARNALGLRTAEGVNELRKARAHWEIESLMSLLADLEVLGVKKIADQIAFIAKATGRTEAAVKQARASVLRRKK